MKKTTFLIMLLLICSNTKAQFSEKNAIYNSGELCVGNYPFGLNLNLNYVYDERYSVQIGAMGAFRKAKDQPKDLHRGFGSAFSFGLANLTENLASYQILVGKVFNLNKEKTIRINLSLGAGYNIQNHPFNWKKRNNPENHDSAIGYVVAGLAESFVGNYSYEKKKKQSFGLVINPKIEFTLTRFWGLTVSPIIQINKYNNYYGIGVGQMIGLLRKKEVRKMP